jgi:hypothetical protein
MHKDWQGRRICANPFTLESETPRNLILCGELKGQVAQGEVRYVRNVSVTYFRRTFLTSGAREGQPKKGSDPREVR